MNLLIWFLLYVMRAEVHFGALTIPRGNIIAVDEFVHVQLDYSDFVTLPKTLYRLQQHTVSIQESLPKSTDDSTAIIYRQFQEKITSISAVLSATAQYFQAPAKHNRRKRGLINILGHISKTLFGTATEDDVNKLNDKVDQFALVLTDNMKTIKATVEYNNQQTRIINQLIEEFSVLGKQLGDLKSEVYDLIHILLYLDNIYIKSTVLYDLIRQHLNDLTFTMNHVLSPNLITPFNLMHLLKDIENKFHFDLSHVYDQIPQFYQLIEPLLIQDFIVLRIPVSSKAPIPLFFIHPFPSLYQSSAFILNASDTFVAYSNQSLYYAEIEPQVVNQCKNLNSYYYCPAEFLTWERALLTQNCMLDLITNATNRLAECNYRVFSLSSSHMYTDIDGRSRYLVTNIPEIGILQCPTNTTPMTYRVTLNQTNLIPSQCSLKSSNLHVEGTLIHRMTWKQTRPTISSKNFTHLSLPDLLVRKISELELETLPNFSIGTLLHPVVLASSSMGLIILIALVVLGCLFNRYRKASSSFTPNATAVHLASPQEPPSVQSKRISIHHVALPSQGSF